MREKNQVSLPHYYQKTALSLAPAPPTVGLLISSNGHQPPLSSMNGNISCCIVKKGMALPTRPCAFSMPVLVNVWGLHCPFAEFVSSAFVFQESFHSTCFLLFSPVLNLQSMFSYSLGFPLSKRFNTRQMICLVSQTSLKISIYLQPTFLGKTSGLVCQDVGSAVWVPPSSLANFHHNLPVERHQCHPTSVELLLPPTECSVSKLGCLGDGLSESRIHWYM